LARHREPVADKSDPPKSKREARDAELAAALRANLRRRKAASGSSAPLKPEKKDDPPA
jgi:hypothetical protein